MAENSDYGALGLNIIGGIMDYNADMKAAKAKRAWQAYSNTMVSLSNALSQNVITDNTIMAEAQSAQAAIDIKRNNLLASASTEVQAAAAGTAGNSVERSMTMLNRNAAEAERNRQIQRENLLMGFDQQRVNSGLQAAMQKDYSYIPKPSFGQYMFKAFANSASGFMK